MSLSIYLGAHLVFAMQDMGWAPAGALHRRFLGWLRDCDRGAVPGPGSAADKETPAIALRAGDLVQVTRAASVQFVTPIMFRVIRVLDRVTYDGWIWLDGYQLNARGNAVARRSIFVQPAGLVVQRGKPLSPRRSPPAAGPVPGAGRAVAAPPTPAPTR